MKNTGTKNVIIVEQQKTADAGLQKKAQSTGVTVGQTKLNPAKLLQHFECFEILVMNEVKL